MTDKERDEMEQFPRVNFDEFTPPSYDEWKAEVEKALKGGIFEKKMFTKTYEGITLEPIYTIKRNEDAIAKSTFPGSGEFQRGVRASGYIKDSWGVFQSIEDTMPAECNKSLKHEIEKGSGAYNIKLDALTRANADFTEGAKIGDGGVSISTLQDMAETLKDLDVEKYPFYIETGASALTILSLLVAAVKADGRKTSQIKGMIGADPVGTLVKDGKLYASLETCFDEMASVALWAKENAPSLRTINVCGDAYHNGGANDVQEVAYAFTTAILYIRNMQQRGLDIDDIADQIIFTFSIGANFFMEIAKLRCARVIWAQILESFGASAEKRRMIVHGRTSTFTKTVYDPYVNMLRNTTQAFSGVVGGLDSLEVSAFDEPIRKSDTFSRRIARNTQIMMQEEFELRQPVDPAGGSWYIETLAIQLTDKIWAELQKIEGMGGIMAALREGYPQAEVKKIMDSRFSALEKRSDVAVGNNMYPNMVEELLDPKTEDQDALLKLRKEQVESYKKDLDDKFEMEQLENVLKEPLEGGRLVDVVIESCSAGASLAELRKKLSEADIESEEIQCIPSHRWTERFEELRMRTEDYKRTHNGEGVKVFLANMGPIPQHKGRADFSTGFMEVAAFDVIKNDGFPTTDEAAQAALESGADVTIICSSDPTYPELVPPLAKKLKELMPGKKVFLAGAAPADMEPIYREAGVDDFVHVRANCYQILSDIQREKGMMD